MLEIIKNDVIYEVNGKKICAFTPLWWAITIWYQLLGVAGLVTVYLICIIFAM